MNTKERLSIKRVLNSILEDIEITVQQIMIEKGVPSHSNLVKSVEVKNQRNTIVVYCNEYYEWLSKGRKKFTRKIPISALLYWIKHYKIRPRKGITVNQLAYIFQNSIYKEGIKGRNFIKATEGAITRVMTKELEKFYITEIENGIIQTINKK